MMREKPPYPVLCHSTVYRLLFLAALCGFY